MLTITPFDVLTWAGVAVVIALAVAVVILLFAGVVQQVRKMRP